MLAMSEQLANSMNIEVISCVAQDGRQTTMSRRRFLGVLAAVPGVLSLWPWPVRAGQWDRRALAFDHTHTGEKLSLVYYDNGTYIPDALDRIGQLLRDHRTGDVHAIDPALLDVLHEVQRLAGSQTPYQVISGYRSPATNKWLRAQGRRVARRSLHMEGKAIDVRLTDLESARLRDTALALRKGGVGFYARPDFVHLDVGRVRSW